MLWVVLVFCDTVRWRWGFQDLQTCERDWTAKLAALEAQHAQQLVEVQGQQDAERDALHRRRSEELQLASMAHQDELHARAVEVARCYAQRYFD